MTEEDETAAQFFSSPPPEGLHAADPLHEEPRAIDLRRSLVPPERHARNLRIVKTAVVVCSLLCVVAALRVVTTRGHVALDAARPRVVAALERPAPAPEPAPAVVPEPPPTVESVATAEPAPAADPRWPDARAATRAAIAALERHRLDDAVTAATSATVLDPADGEAWLVLGAAYQDSGKMAEARASYRTCTVQGRIDPRGECAAMIRSLGAR